MEKAKHILSTIPSTEVVVDSFVEGFDFHYALTRYTYHFFTSQPVSADIEQLCAEELSRVGKLIESVLQSASILVRDYKMLTV